MEFNILKADIVNVPANAVVLPANEKLKEGSGTSRAIFSAAGRAMLTKACKEIGYCKTGTAVPTKAYKLNADYIIHAAVPRWKGEITENTDCLVPHIFLLLILLIFSDVNQ